MFDLVRYWYANGRPSRVEVASVSSDLQTLNGYSTYYLQYNWHGDVVVWVAPDGGGNNTTTLTTDPWGVYSSDTFQYYLWNGAWGYLYFSPLKLYYVHGRWYNPDTGLFLSPSEIFIGGTPPTGRIKKFISRSPTSAPPPTSKDCCSKRKATPPTPVASLKCSTMR